jgi:ATP-dependent Clp protease adaptor protein ClpS
VPAGGRREQGTFQALEGATMAQEKQAEADVPAESEAVQATATAERSPEKSRKKPKRLPPYHVILWNDEDHSFGYVIAMMQKLFGHPRTKGFEIAETVHLQGKAIVLTTTKEHAELKRDQIHAYGKDDLIDDCAGSMWATIEPSVG